MSDNQFYQMGDAPTVSSEASMFPAFNSAFTAEVKGDVPENALPVPVVPSAQTIPVNEVPFTDDEIGDIKQEMSDLSVLIPLRDEIIEQQAVSIEHVQIVDRLIPDLIASKRPHAMFSAYPSVAGYTIATEALGETIVAKIKKLFGYIVNALKRLGQRISQYMGKSAEALDFEALQKEWEEVVDRAIKKDAVKGVGYFKERYGNTSIGKKSSNFKHFIQLSTTDELKKRFDQMFTVGMGEISNGTVKTLLTEQNRKLATLLTTIETTISHPDKASIEPLKKLNYPFIVMSGDVVLQDKSKEAIQALGDRLSKEAKATVTNLPTLCIMANAPKELRKTSKDLEEMTDKLTSQIEKQITSLDQNHQYLQGLTVLQNIAVAVNLTSSQQVLYYQQYERLYNAVKGVVKTVKSLI